jgi:hypothetical protein
MAMDHRMDMMSMPYADGRALRENSRVGPELLAEMISDAHRGALAATGSVRM